jgi:hypothetical protein
VIASTGQAAYAAAWGTAVVLAAGITIARRREVGLATGDYARLLMRPWKVVTFGAATLLVVAAGPCSGDPTWDVADSVLVSSAVFLLAPWSVGTLYRDISARTPRLRTAVALVAFCVPCWVYDAWIALREGAYPSTWAWNLGLTGPVTLLAGAFWNLGRAEGESSVFSFRWSTWPVAESSRFRDVLWPVMVLAAPVVALVATFVVLPLAQR